MSSKITKLMDEVIREKLLKLKENVDNIKFLPEYSDEQLSLSGKSITLAIWKRDVEGEKTGVVVQAYSKGFLGCGIMVADGFVVDSNGQVLPLPEDVRLEFC